MINESIFGNTFRHTHHRPHHQHRRRCHICDATTALCTIIILCTAPHRYVERREGILFILKSARWQINTWVLFSNQKKLKWHFFLLKKIFQISASKLTASHSSVYTLSIFKIASKQLIDMLSATIWRKNTLWPTMKIHTTKKCAREKMLNKFIIKVCAANWHACQLAARITDIYKILYLAQLVSSSRARTQ